MFTLEPRSTVISASPLEVDFLSGAVTDVAFIAPNQVLCQIIESLEVVAGIGDLVWFETKPFDNLADRDDIPLLLGFGIRVVVTEITLSTMIARKAEIDGDSLAVTDMEISIWL